MTEPSKRPSLGRIHSEAADLSKQERGRQVRQPHRRLYDRALQIQNPGLSRGGHEVLDAIPSSRRAY